MEHEGDGCPETTRHGLSAAIPAPRLHVEHERSGRTDITPGSERPPQILQIYRDSLVPGREAEFRAVEEDAARACAELGYPHAHLALQPLGGAQEVWWLNAFRSEADRQQVTREYESNAAMVRALQTISRRRDGLVGTPLDVLAQYRPDLSRRETWHLAGARFFVAEVTRGEPRLAGAVFEAPDGTRYVLRPARTADEAEHLAAKSGGDAMIYAVRPYWGMPATEWIAADPEFWRINPAARQRGGVA